MLFETGKSRDYGDEHQVIDSLWTLLEHAVAVNLPTVM